MTGCLHRVSIMKTRLFKYIENFTTKTWKVSDKNSYIFHIIAQNIDCGYSLELPQWGSSNEYSQSMFWAEIRKNNVYPCKPQFFYIKMGFKGGQNYIGMFLWWKWARVQHFLQDCMCAQQRHRSTQADQSCLSAKALDD